VLLFIYRVTTTNRNSDDVLVVTTTRPFKGVDTRYEYIAEGVVKAMLSDSLCDRDPVIEFRATFFVLLS
jgi:hypothetical protein